jgi:DNA-binding NarL/FixJ family response regulator
MNEPLRRVFVIDDHCLIRYGFDAAFNAETYGIAIAGCACSVPEALQYPAINEAEVVLSYESDIQNQLIMFREGAKAFLNKSQERDEIVHTLHLVCNGSSVVSEEAKLAALKAAVGGKINCF